MDAPLGNVTPARPPAELVVVTVLAFVTGVSEIVVGIVLMFLRYAPTLERSPYRPIVTIVGAATVLLGLFVISLASGLLRARQDARILLTILFSISFALGLLVLLVDAADGWFRFVDLTISAGIVAVLWTGRVARFFARSDGGRTG